MDLEMLRKVFTIYVVKLEYVAPVWSSYLRGSAGERPEEGNRNCTRNIGCPYGPIWPSRPVKDEHPGKYCFFFSKYPWNNPFKSEQRHMVAMFF